jgi:hypothetical protein
MELSDACAREEAQRIRAEEGNALSSIRYFANVGEVRLLVITDRVPHRTFEFTPKMRLKPSLKVIRANLREWESKRLELVPSEWRNEPAIVLESD